MLNKIKDEIENPPTPGPLFGLPLPELTALMKRLNQPAYRATQLHHALYRQRVAKKRKKSRKIIPSQRNKIPTPSLTAAQPYASPVRLVAPSTVNSVSPRS